MTESSTSAGGGPSAKDVEERIKEGGEGTNLGAGEEEPDPATAEAPPSDLQAGDTARKPD